MAMHRRTFLSAAAAAAAAAAAPIAAAADGGPAPSETLTVALIGAGAQGQHLLETALKIPGIRFAAVCDIWKEYSLSRASGILTQAGFAHATYVDYREMLEKERDLAAAIIATPDSCHAEQTVACLRAGLHVYCEAPMSTTLDGARAMVKAARETRKLLQIGNHRRSHPRYRHGVEKLLREIKLLGKIAAANGQWNVSMAPDIGFPKRYAIPEDVLAKHGYASMAQFRNWRWYKKFGGGFLASMGCHQLDVYNWFLGAVPRAIFASGGVDFHDTKTHECHDTVMAILEYETPAGTVRASYQIVTTNGNYRHFEKFLGDRGTLVLSEVEGLSGVFREGAISDWQRWVDLEYLVRKDSDTGGAGERTEVPKVTDSVGPTRYDLPARLDEPWHKPHLENFFDAVRGAIGGGRGAAPAPALACPAEIGYQATVTSLKVAEAIEARRPVELTPNDFTV